MIQIDIDMPEGCQKCKFFKKHIFVNGLDYSYSCMLGAKEFPMPWIRQMEERAGDCPLQEVKREHCKDCKYFEYDSVAKVDSSARNMLQKKRSQSKGMQGF